uniref:Fibroblast growth factor binding protein 2a n=1 Tax=Anabas testudineus TaxID=64144 RepID=A0A7N6BPM1_ANATE
NVVALLMLLLACCLWPADAQSIRGQNIWDEPIKFKTKSKDSCTMTVTGLRQYTRLRVACEGSENSYWCDFVGKPQTCRPYNKNPRHYFIQMMWGLRKLTHACMGQRRIKPHMCRNATDESQMVFSTASYYPLRSRTRGQPTRPQPQPAPTMRHSESKTSPKSIQLTTEKTIMTTTPQPTTPPKESTAKRMAQQYCWRSLQGICSFVIGLFQSE